VLYRWGQLTKWRLGLATVHFYGGMMKRVPEDWHFLRCGVFDLWWQWWIGDQVRQVPPLRNLSILDVNHLDRMPVTEEEMHGRTGVWREQRRPARKILNDIKFLMKWVGSRVEAAQAVENIITISSVDRMFLAVAQEFEDGEREGQKKWNTVVNSLRRQKVSIPEGLTFVV